MEPHRPEQNAHAIPGSIKNEIESAPAEIFAQISEASDDCLLEQVSEGIEEALSLLFHRHARSVRNIARRILRDEGEADDLVQEIFFFIFRRAALFDATCGTARSWIFQIAYHRAVDRWRYLSSRHFYTNQNLDEAGLHLAAPGGMIGFNEMSLNGIFGKRLGARLNCRLTPEQRETIHLFFFEGYTLKEIAELTGHTLINVRSHYYRGLKQLRKYIFEKTPLEKSQISIDLRCRDDKQIRKRHAAL